MFERKKTKEKKERAPFCSSLLVDKFGKVLLLVHVGVQIWIQL